MGIIAWIVFGLIAGALAKAIMPGRDGGGFIMTTLLGIVGSVVGGFVGSLFGLGRSGDFSIGSFVTAIVGALIVLYVYHLATRRSTV